MNHLFSGEGGTLLPEVVFPLVIAEGDDPTRITPEPITLSRATLEL